MGKDRREIRLIIDMAHDRKLVLGGSSITLEQLEGVPTFQAAPIVRDELEREMIESGYLEGAPFRWVGVVIRYGLKYEAQPHINGIDKTHGDLDLAIEIDTHDLLDADLDGVVAMFRKATLTALVGAGEKYGLKVERMRKLLKDAL